MRVVFLEDVTGVALGGDVKEVKNGFARNYLIPQNLAVPATHNALQRVVRLSQEADVTRLRVLKDMKALAEELDGYQVDVDMRATTSGRLYGSVTRTIIANKLSEVTGRGIDRKSVQLSEPIVELGSYEVNVVLHSDVEASVKVLVYATGTDPNILTNVTDDEGVSVDETEEDGVTEPASVVDETGNDGVETP